MAGHSKWNNIKRRKGAQDAKRGKMFTKLGRELQVAVKEGGSDPDLNKRLADTIARAKSYNMPNDSINRSIKRAAGGDADDYDSIRYEGYGPNGVAIIVDTLTDNRNRTAGSVRHLFTKYGGNLGQTGSVSYLFEEKGEIYIEGEGVDEEELMMLALDAGAEDIEGSEDGYQVTTSPADYETVKKALEEEYTIVDSSVGPVAMTTTVLSEDDNTTMQKMIDDLEDDDDVQNVYSNWDNDSVTEE